MKVVVRGAEIAAPSSSAPNRLYTPDWLALLVPQEEIRIARQDNATQYTEMPVDVGRKIHQGGKRMTRCVGLIEVAMVPRSCIFLIQVSNRAAVSLLAG
jgi:hypothetical protein